MKKGIMIAASFVAIIVMSIISIGYENHVRWNPQLEECVYFYAKSEGEVSHCYVAAAHCTQERGNEYKNIDPVECSSTPLNGGSCALFTEGDRITLSYDARDPDDDVLEYSVSEPFDSSQTWQTERGDAGNYTVTVEATDGELTTTEEICFTIMSGNSAPELTVDDVTVEEGELAQLAPQCTDPDGDGVTLTFEGDLTRPVWQTTFEDAGTYTTTVTCIDTQNASVSKEVTVTVEDVNMAPLLVVEDSVEVMETEVVMIDASCEDPEDMPTNLTYSGDMTRRTWRTGYEDAGEYTVNVTCTDDTGKSSSATVDVTVNNKNRAPMITAMVTAE